MIRGRAAAVLGVLVAFAAVAFLLAAIGLVTTTLLGVVMAFRISAGVVAPLLSLLGGVALPVGLLLIYR